MGIHYIEDTELQKVVEAIKEKNDIETFNGADMAKEIKKQPFMKLLIDGGRFTDKCYEITEEDLEGLIYLQSYCFYGCRWIKKITIPETVTIWNNNCFNGCQNVEEIHLPSGMTGTGTSGFNQCRKLKKINVENFTSVGNYGFQRCDELEKLDFYNLTQIGSSAFNECEKLATLIIRTDSVCKMANINALTGTPIASGTGFVYVPDDLVESYKTAENWVTYASQIKPISELQEGAQ